MSYYGGVVGPWFKSETFSLAILAPFPMLGLISCEVDGKEGQGHKQHLNEEEKDLEEIEAHSSQ